jgi:predicted PurR-regulated permease PerM
MGELPRRNSIMWFFLACFFSSFLLLGWLLSPFLSIIVLGAVVAGMTYPLYLTIYQRLKIRASIAALIICLLIFILLFVPTVFFVGSLAQQALGLYQMAKDAVINEQINALLRSSHVLEKINGLLSHFDFVLTGEELKNGITGVIKFVGLFLYEQARAIASNTLLFVINFFLMLLVVYFLLLDGERLIKYIRGLSPFPETSDLMLMSKFKKIARVILLVNGWIALIQGTMGGVLFLIFGFQSAFLWGVIMGILAFIPIIGIGSVLVPVAIYLFLKGQVAVGIVFLVYYAVAAGTENLLRPKWVGDQTEMHPLLTFFAIIGGLKLFGILGIIYGPLVVTAFLTMADIYRANYQRMVESGSP